MWDAMIDIYEKYGYHVDAIHTLTLKGIEGLEKIKSIMDQLKSHTPKEIAGLEVLWARNYDNDTATNMKNKAVVPTGLPKSNPVQSQRSNSTMALSVRISMMHRRSQRNLAKQSTR